MHTGERDDIGSPRNFLKNLFMKYNKILNGEALFEILPKKH
jgi:hypothetical protein